LIVLRAQRLELPIGSRNRVASSVESTHYRTRVLIRESCGERFSWAKYADKLA